MNESTLSKSLCLCGCGAGVNPGNRYVRNHHSRKRKHAFDYIEEDKGYSTPCWIWQLGTVHGRGGRHYGQVRKNGKSLMAHRLYYEREYGPMPDGLEIDHLCTETLCVRPEHLEAVTHRENMRRLQASKTPCPCCNGKGWV